MISASMRSESRRPSRSRARDLTTRGDAIGQPGKFLSADDGGNNIAGSGGMPRRALLRPMTRPSTAWAACEPPPVAEVTAHALAEQYDLRHASRHGSLIRLPLLQ